MADLFDKKTRSSIMSKIRSKHTKPEVALAKLLRKNKLAFRRHAKVLGTPDFILFNTNVAIFVDGEFWHGYNWLRRGKRPRTSFWRKKLERNMARDKRVNKAFKRAGWVVVRIWETQLAKRPETVLRRILRSLGRK